jgi:hypothetical protein
LAILVIMTVDARDRARMRRIAETLAQGETEEELEEPRRARVVAEVNAHRARAGRPPLREPWEHRPESGLVRRARALGIRRIDR